MTDGVVGMVSQALGLAERVGLPVERKDIVLSQPWASLPGAFWPPGVFGLHGTKGARLDPPWPALVVSCGRKSVGPALAIRRASGGRTLAVHVQHPHVRLDRFDLVVAPSHDRIDAPNVLVTTGAVHRVSRDRLAALRVEKPDLYAGLPRPLVAVLIGGGNKAYRLTPELSAVLADRLRAAADALGAGLLVTVSRRTGDENIAALRERLNGPTCLFYDGSGENPYFDYLAMADAIIATGDSVNMVSEAATTGKPVYIVALERAPGAARAAAKFEAFHEAMYAAGAARPFDGFIDPDWQPAPLDETARAADRIRTMLRDRLGIVAPYPA